MSNVITFVRCAVLISLICAIDASTTKFACENKELTLSCAQGKILQITSADYGRSIGSICQHKLNSNINCHTPNAEKIVRNACEKKEKCKIFAGNSIFGDPCLNTYKYLEVKYKCVPAPICTEEQFKCKDSKCLDQSQLCDGMFDCSDGDDEAGCDYKVAHVCEGSKQKLECPTKEIIQILQGHYGRRDKMICSQSNNANTNCESLEANRILTELCHDKNSCDINASNAVFGDPCSGTTKYVSLYYYCNSGSTDEDSIVFEND